MAGRHAGRKGRLGLRWIAGAAGLLVAASAVVAMAPAGAAPKPVVVTMGVTGASASNCGGLSLGGSDVYVTPDGELDFQTTLAGVSLLGLQLGLSDISAVANLGGTMIIDPKTTSQMKFAVDASKTVKVSPQLAAGDHPYTFAFDTVTLLSLIKLPLSNLLPSGPLGVGVQLTYHGTIHVTTEAAQCGVSLQLPGPVVSASLPGAPPIVVSLPPVAVPTLPVNLPTPLPETILPKTKTTVTATAPKASTNSGVGYTPPPVTIPQVVMGGIHAGGGFGGVRPDTAGITQLGSGLTSSIGPEAAATTAAPLPTPEPSRNGRQVQLAANTPPAAQLPVLLAILAIIALSLVTATYARLYLLRRNVA